MQIDILSGVYADATGDFRTSYPLNLVPVPKESGISKGYLAPAEGLTYYQDDPGIGTDRGGVNWNGTHYRVMGTKLIQKKPIDPGYNILGDVGPGDTISGDHVGFAYSFDLLAIRSGGRLYYYGGGLGFIQVLDPDLGYVKDLIWIDGYFMTTDGTYLIVTELNDPTQINPLKYGSAETDPDSIVGLMVLRGEVYAMNRYTIEVFDNVGGDGFPFARITGATVPRGLVGVNMKCLFSETIAFMGSGKSEQYAIYLVNSGTTLKISTREIDKIMPQYKLANGTNAPKMQMESRYLDGHQFLYLHFGDGGGNSRTLVYDAAASQTADRPIWFELSSVVNGTGGYRARNFVFVYDTWIYGDTNSTRLGTFSKTVSSHFDSPVAWEFGTAMIYNAGKGAIVNSVELIGLPGRVEIGKDPTIWTSYSVDGQTWSTEMAISAGKLGDRLKRMQWRRQGKMRNYRTQKFRGTSDAHLSIAALEAEIEPLNV